MTSYERHEARYQRRKAKREENKRLRNLAIGSIEDVFSFRNMYDYGKDCCNNVRWKQSAQNFEVALVSGSASRRREVINGTYKNMPYVHFQINERGKTREIDAPHIFDRQVHKVMGNEVLLPLYQPSMIRDNGASLKGKGLHWQFQELKKHLAWHFRRYGCKGAILTVDLKGFFPNAPIDKILERHQEIIQDPRIRKALDAVVLSSPSAHTGRGMPLGVEVSQQEMIALPSSIDNWAKCQKSIHCFGHYMDDYYAILPDIDELKQFMEELIAKFEEMGITVNRNKCHIIPLTKPFRFCKAKFTLTKTGKILVNGNRGGIKRTRRKLRKFKSEYEAGKRSLESVQQTVQSQTAYYKNYNDHERVLKINRMFYSMFIKPQTA